MSCFPGRSSCHHFTWYLGSCIWNTWGSYREETIYAKKYIAMRVLNALCIHLPCISTKCVLIPNLWSCMAFLKPTLGRGQWFPDKASNHSVTVDSWCLRLQEHTTGALTATNTFLIGFTETPYLENSPLILKGLIGVSTVNSLHQHITISQPAAEKSSSPEMNDSKEWNTYTHRETKTNKQRKKKYNWR